MEYYNEWIGEVTGDAIAHSDYESNDLVTPLKPVEFDLDSVYSRANYSRLHEVQPGLATRMTYVGSVAKDPEGRDDLSGQVTDPQVSVMSMTATDPFYSISTYSPGTHVPFARNSEIGLEHMTKEVGDKQEARTWSTNMAVTPGVFCHQTVDSQGAQFPLSALGTASSGQAEGTVNNVGVSSWRPVNMMNLSPTMNPNTDLHLGIERHQDTTRVVKSDSGQYVNTDGTVTTSATGPNGEVLSPLEIKETQKRCFSTRTETHDCRLLLPNTGNEFIKLWREDLYEEANKESNGGKHRPFGSSLNSHEKSMQQLTVYDQVSDQWLLPGERPTGRSFSSMYHQKKKTRVMVEPNSIISYQFFADPGIDGESRLLNSDLLKENFVGLFDHSNTHIEGYMNTPGDEYTEKILGQNQFFDTRSRVCMVFANGAPTMVDGVSVTKPVSVNYTVKTLEKVTYVPKFYDRMQRLVHAKSLPPGFGPKFYDSEFIDEDEKAHMDAAKQEMLEKTRPSAKISHASKKTKAGAQVSPARSKRTRLMDSFGNLSQVNDHFEHAADVAGKGVQILGNTLRVAQSVAAGYKLAQGLSTTVGALATAAMV